MELTSEELIAICRAFVQASAQKISVKNSVGPTEQQLEWSDTLCNGKSVDYDAAEKACAALGEGWRLPTRMELESILDLTRQDPAIDTKRFPDTKSAWYWTSTPCAWAPGASAWVVHFGLGDAYGNRRSDYACVRAVRSVPAGQ